MFVGLFTKMMSNLSILLKKFCKASRKKSVRDVVLGFITIIERQENEEIRAIYRARSYRFVSFFISSFIIRLKLKTTVSMFYKLLSEPRLLKTTQTFFWILWVKTNEVTVELSNPLKNRKCYVYLPMPYNRPSLSRDHQRVTIMNHWCYGFDGV